MSDVIRCDWFDATAAKIRRDNERQDHKIDEIQAQLIEFARSEGLAWRDGQWVEVGLRVVKS